MRRILLAMAILVCTGTVQAGVYNLDPPRKYPSDYVEANFPQPLWQVMSYLGELRGIQDNDLYKQKPPPPDSLRVSYEKQYEALEAKRQAGTLAVVDRINLSACLIRLGRTSQARDRLEEALRLVPRDNAYRFLLLLNLAAVYQDDESLAQRALDLQQEALQSWPTMLPGFSRRELAWYRRAELYALTLMELRNRERLAGRGRSPIDLPPPDLLFPREERDLAKKLQFVGDRGEYEAGGIAWKQLDRVPSDAYQIVLQLLLWRPHDFRLYWLFGELLNAQGQVEWAYFVLDMLRSNNLWRSRELERHLRVLRDAVKPYKELFTDSTGSGEDRRKQATLLWWLRPRGSLLPPGVGVLADEAGGLALTSDSGDAGGLPLPPAPPTEQAAAPPAGNALPDWRPMTVSFLTGIIVAVLGLLQWQQWRRRKKALSSGFTQNSELRTQN